MFIIVGIERSVWGVLSVTYQTSGRTAKIWSFALMTPISAVGLCLANLNRMVSADFAPGPRESS